MKKQNPSGKTQVTFEITERQGELLSLMLGKANLEAEKIFTNAMKRWVVKNADLLTDKELKSFADILPSLQPKPKTMPKSKTTTNAKKN